GRVGGVEGLVRQEADDGIESRVDRLDPVQVRLDHLAAADLTVADHTRELDGTLTPQSAHAYPLRVEIEATVSPRTDSGKEDVTCISGRRGTGSASGPDEQPGGPGAGGSWPARMVSRDDAAERAADRAEHRAEDH